MDDIFISDDTTPPSITPSTSPNLSCDVPSAQLVFNVTNVETYSWTGPNGFATSEAQPIVAAPGTYTLTGTGTNGCSATASVEVTGDTNIPVANAGGNRTITCASPTVSIGSNAINGMTYLWTGPAISVDNQSQALLEINQAGTYFLRVTSPANCVAMDTVIVDLNTNPPIADAGIDGVISCTTPSIILDATNSSQGNEFSYTWTGQGINSSASQQTVNQAGTYTLVVTNNNNGCTATDEILIADDTTPPSITASTSPNLSCDMPSAQLVFNVTNVETYSWTGPNGFTTSEAQPIVAAPGTYTLTGTGTNGCSASASVEVTGDTNIPVANAGGNRTITCANPTVSIGSNAINGMTYLWTGPAISVDNQNEAVLEVNQAGTYLLKVTSPANCVATDTIIVDLNTAPPIADAGVDGVISCTTPSIILDAVNSSQGNEFSYTWTGQGINSSASQQTVNQAGTYTLVVTNNNNGCTATDEILIVDDTAPPSIIASNSPNLSCDMPSAQLVFEVTNVDTYSWLGPNGYTSSEAQPTIAAPGTYTLTGTGTNGCSASASVEVTGDTNIPVANAGGNRSITCFEPSIMIGSPAINGMTYLWTGPGVSIDNQNEAILEISQAGDYLLTVTSPANCVATDMISVTLDNAPPNANAGQDQELNCSATTVLVDATNSSQGDEFSYAWTGNGINSNLDQVTIDQAGTYTLAVTNTSNGCTATDEINITTNTTPPIVDSGSSPDISCDNPSIVLMASANEEVEVKWTGPNGFSSTEIQPTINTPGLYTLVATASNGCTATTSINIGGDTNIPIAEVGLPHTLTCDNPTYTLGGPTDDALSYLWTGPAITTDNQELANPTINQPGTYTLTVTNKENACMVSNSVVITGEGLVGTTCDDGNPDTDKDQIQDNCECLGTDIPCNIQDSLTLVDWYTVNGRDNWTITWDLTQPMSTWFGVCLNSEGCVSSLEFDGSEACSGNYIFTGNNISGPFPDVQLESLTTLNLNGNPITTLPDFTGLSSLVSLGIAKTTTLSSVPDFSNLPNLRALDLQDNPISTLPNFSNLTKLVSLILCNLDISTVPDFQGIPALTRLWICNNSKLNSIPNFTNLPKLSRLFLSGNQLDQTIPNLTAISRELAVLELQDNRLTFEDLLPNFANIKASIERNNMDSQAFVYAPQAKIYKDTTIRELAGNPLLIDLEIDAAISSNIYTWSKDGQFYRTIKGNNQLVFDALRADDAGIYTVAVTNLNALELTLESHEIIIDIDCPIIDNDFTATICEGENYQIGEKVFTSSGNYTEILSSYLGCDSTVNLTLQVEGVATLGAADAGLDKSTCNDEYLLIGNEPNNTFGKWTTTSGAILQNPTNSETMANNLGEGDNTFTWVLSTDQCPEYDAASIVVFRNIDVQAIDDTLYFEYGEEQELNILENDRLAPDVEWTLQINNDASIGRVFDKLEGKVSYAPEGGFYGTTSFTYELCSATCEDCSNAVVTVLIDKPESKVDRIFVPSGFTPNGDGQNDLFIIPELEENPEDFPNNQLMVFNRWGAVVFEAQPYANNWSGTNAKTGRDLPAGTYYYIARLDIGEGIIRRGEVTIVR